MRIKIVLMSASFFTFMLFAKTGFSQAPVLEGTGPSQAPVGFMIEGILAQQLFSLGYIQMMGVPSAAGVPNAVIGYKAKSVAIGLGIGFFRMGMHEETGGEKYKDYFTMMLFSPRFEITLYRSKRGRAEAFLALSFGAGFHHTKSKGGGDEDSDEDVILGGQAGLGAQVFLAGSPFALGGEMGWSGIFLRQSETDPVTGDEIDWINLNGAYAAIFIKFVFN